MNTVVKRFGSLARGAALVVPLLQLMSGCARRFDLSPGELARVETSGSQTAAPAAPAAPEVAGEPHSGGDVAAKRPRPELAQLRVYLSRRMRSYYAQDKVLTDFEVTTHKISESGAHRPRVRRISRRVPGMVIAEDTQGSMRRLWVTFSKACDQPACAYAFVETELGRYSLVVVPQLKTYKEPKSYRRTRLKRNLLRLARQRSLSEVNEVLAAVRSSGKVLTIDLQVLKDRRRPTRSERESLGGVGF